MVSLDSMVSEYFRVLIEPSTRQFFVPKDQRKQKKSKLVEDWVVYSTVFSG